MADYQINPRDVCIVGVARTPIGDFLGSLSSLSATSLGSFAIQSALERANVPPSLVQELFFGNVLSANLGQAPARQAALAAALPTSLVCTTINKVCSSGLKATMLAALSIQAGANDIVVAGGMESMSNVPKYLPNSWKGSRLGHDSVVDGMIKDGLWDVYNDFGMGVCGELCADTYGITRHQQDDYAVRSFNRGIAAQKNGAFKWEIAPVKVSAGKGKAPTIVDKDEALTKFDAAKLRKLRPSFKVEGGTVTAGNASSISDGAAALVLVSGEKALELGLKVIARIRGFADAAQAPELFTTAPALAIPKAISNAGFKASQIDYYEINEAFSQQQLLDFGKQEQLQQDEEKDDDTIIMKRVIRRDLGDGSSVVYYPCFISQKNSWDFFHFLNHHIPWSTPTIHVFGKPFLQPRDSCYVATKGLKELSYSGHKPHAYNWDDFPPLKQILDQVHQALPGTHFNTLLLNRYNTGNHYVGWHADNETLYGPTPEIASVSFGCERDFLLKKRTTNNNNNPPTKRPKYNGDTDCAHKCCFTLKHGSLLVMRGNTQRDWLHSVPKRAKANSARINLTFRRVIM